MDLPAAPLPQSEPRSPVSPGSAGPPARLEALDGLRGLSALMVMAVHFLQLFPVFDWTLLPDRFAVILFFVLSGYVLTLPHFDNRPQLLEQRFVLRYARLALPSGLAVLATYALSGGSGWVALREAAFGSLLLSEISFVPPLWTISVEFFGSLLVLAIYFPKGRRRRLALLLSIALILAFYRENGLYLLAILGGAHLARVRMGAIGLGVCAVLGLYLGFYNPDIALYSWLPGSELRLRTGLNTLAALLLVLAVIHGFGARLLRTGLCLYLGRISFPLYILHWGILKGGVKPLAEAHQMSTLWAACLFVAITFLVSDLFERGIDRPFTAWSKRVYTRLSAPK